MEPSILLEDEWLLVLDKPSGYFSHPSPLERKAPDCQTWVRDTLGFKAQAAHRLDRATSGILLLGKTPTAAQALMAQFQAGSVQKTYQALVRGWLLQAGVVDSAIQTHRGLQEAFTQFRPLQHYEMPWPLHHPTSRYTWLELHPQTGRQHQLRRHLAHLRHPILGDSTHGDNRQNRHFAQKTGWERLLLFAVELVLAHPGTQEPCRLQCPPPQDLMDLLQPYSLVRSTTESP